MCLLKKDIFLSRILYLQLMFVNSLKFSVFIPQHYFIFLIQSWPKISAPLVNMIKEGCKNVSALLIILIFYLKNSQKSNLSLDNKN